jgi:hypothetical protein
MKLRADYNPDQWTHVGLPRSFRATLRKLSKIINTHTKRFLDQERPVTVGARQSSALLPSTLREVHELINDRTDRLVALQRRGVAWPTLDVVDA